MRKWHKDQAPGPGPIHPHALLPHALEHDTASGWSRVWFTWASKGPAFPTQPSGNLTYLKNGTGIVGPEFRRVRKKSQGP